MKKIFEKHDLLKFTGIFILIAIILTWIVPSGYYQQGAGMTTDEINRVGLTAIMQQGLVSFTYFAANVTFLFCLGAFYEVLSKTAGYQKLVDSFSKKVKGHEKVFVIISMLFFAVLASMMSEYFPLLIFIPFIITVLNRLKVPKISAFIATFGGILIGILGNTTSTKVVGILDSIFRGAGSGTPIKSIDTKIFIVQLVLFACSAIILGFFSIKSIKTNKDKKAESYDRFDIEKVKSPKKNPVMWPYVVGTILITITTIFAYLPWSSSLWDVKFFEDATKWVNELSLFGSPIISYIFGDFTAFGTWDLFGIQYVMLTVILLILIFGRFTFDEILDTIGEGIKKVTPLVVVFLFVYAVLVFTAQFPVLPVIIDKIASITKGFNSAIAFICAFITSIFGVEMQYVASLSGTYFAAEASKHVKELYLIFQMGFGYALFFVPTSAVLMLGLSYLDIPYKDYLKFIWKFLIAMLIIIGIIIIII